LLAWWRAWGVRSRQESVPVWMMWAMAAQSRGSVKVEVHSLKAALDAIAMEARSSRSVKTWNSSSAPRRSSSR
jgi:hypothetical protein